MISIVLLVSSLSLLVSVYICINFTKNPNLVPIVKKTRKIPVLKYTTDNIEEVSDDPIQGLVEMALSRETTREVKNLPTTSTSKLSENRNMKLVKSWSNILSAEEDEVVLTSEKSNNAIIEPIKQEKPIMEKVELYSPFKSGLLINLQRESLIDLDSDSIYAKLSPGFTLRNKQYDKKA